MPDTPDPSGRYLWFDTEFTTLDLDEAQLLQVAVVATNARLERLAPPEQDFDCCVRLDDGVRCNAWVEENLAGLLRRCRSTEALPLATVQARLRDYLDALLGPVEPDIKARPVLAGNSIHSDWFLARRYLPGLVARCHYRILDVSSWKVYWANEVGETPFDKEDAAMIKQYFPGEFTSAQDAHDAHFDVLASIAEFNYYRRHMTIRVDGPRRGGAAFHAQAAVATRFTPQTGYPT